MHKIALLFKKRNEGKEKDHIAQLESEFPSLTPQEEEEVFAALGVGAKRDGENAKDVIMGTLRRLHLSRTSSEAGASLSDEEASEGYVEVGTVRVKDWEGHEVMGTVRIKEGNPWGTICIHNLDAPTGTAPWMGTSTIRIASEDVQTALSEGAVQLQHETPQWMNAMKEPEDWELSILALEKGEWIPEMDKNAEAFRKYRKERKQLGNLFAEPKRKRSSPVLTAAPESVVEARKTVERERSQGAASPASSASPAALTPSPSSSALDALLNPSDRSNSLGKKGKKKELKGLEKALADLK